MFLVTARAIGLWKREGSGCVSLDASVDPEPG
jgi:hypothetical protein